MITTSSSFSFLPLLVLLFCNSVAPFRISSSSGCRFSTNIAEDFLPTFKYSEGVVIPERDPSKSSWLFDFSVTDGEEFQIRCPGRGNRLKFFDTRTKAITGHCDDDGFIQTEYGQLAFDKLVCSGRAVSSATRNGTCGGNLTKVDIKIGTGFLYEICHDESRSATYYSKSTIDGPRLDESVSISRPPFAEDDFYPDIDANRCYTQVEQTATVAEIVGENNYIQPAKDLYFARGHLMPNGDGISAEEKIATFYFINAIPQWQSINGGNWERLESALRKYAQDKDRVLTVWTGASGVGTLRDSKGRDHEIYLGKTANGDLVQRLPVPRLVWKVVVDPSSNAGIAVVSIHNPYPEHHEDPDYVCNDVCDSLPWVNWNTEDAKAGITYCCSVDSFRSFIPDISIPSGLGLLK